MKLSDYNRIYWDFDSWCAYCEQCGRQVQSSYLIEDDLGLRVCPEHATYDNPATIALLEKEEDLLDPNETTRPIWTVDE